MKKILILLVAILSFSSFQAEAQRRHDKKVAVYVMGDVDKRDKTVIGSTIVTALTRSEDYQALERTDEFIKALQKEGDYQQENVREKDLAIIGQQMGVDYVALIKVEEYRREMFLGGELIDVETGGVVQSSTEIGYVESMQDLRDLTIKLAKRLVGLETGNSLSGNTIGNSENRGNRNVQNRTFTVNGISFEMVPVEGGSFMMGSYEGLDSEKPVHQETVRDFMIGKTEVTQELWRAVMGSNPSYFSGEKNPVERVSWTDCIAFIGRLNQLTGQNFRLPTEAEWEYAARGGNKSRGYKYSGSDDLYLVGWFNGNSNNRTHEVGTLQPNELGIYDMSGNVWEWTVDGWSSNYNQARDTTSRVNRGGSCLHNSAYCRVAYRSNNTPSNSYHILGLRLAL